MADIKQVGVIGAGQMGSGIAQVFATAGHDVVLQDISPEGLEKARASIEKNLGRMAAKGKIDDAAMQGALSRINTTSELKDLSDCDLAVESATENQAIKVEIFKQLSPMMKPGAIVASNTSSISITALAAVTEHPEKFIGLHFMNPAPVMKLVEVIRGIATSKETFEVTRDLVAGLGKTMAVSEDFPAFIVNRVFNADDK